RAVDEAGVELAVGGGDRLARLAQVRDVVERIMEAKDVDSVLRRRHHEAADEVTPDGLRADEEASAQGHAQRGGGSGADRADAFPGALDSAPDGTVEDASARDLERCEPGSVEQLCQLEDRRRRQ